MNDTYKPLSCSLYDRLETLSTLAKKCEISFIGPDGENLTSIGKIVDLRAVKGEEFLFLEDGTKIRLDKIISTDGQSFIAPGC